MAVNNGPNPKDYGGEMALFYFDCSTNTPIVTVYTYNGDNAFTSYLYYTDGANVADYITSSQNNVGAGKTFSDVSCGLLPNG
jgi:hypothetical protein